MILVVSDLHLGYQKSNRQEFINFLDYHYRADIDHFILLGDIFDFWRCNDEQVIEENEIVLEKLDDLNAENIYYLPGNHDYNMLDMHKKYDFHIPFNFSKYLHIEDGGEKFFFIHGYELEAHLCEFPSIEIYEKYSSELCFKENKNSGFLNKIGALKSILGKKRRLINEMVKEPHRRDNIKKMDDFSLSADKYSLLDMDSDETLIFGHTHRPFIDYDKKVANTGSWVDELPIKNYQNSYIQINDGEMGLHFF